ncbi:transcriptional repressor LexA [Brackiella oedipodis]|uniref:transcriptional repressor LexA n=1 Tax=Brackiella oedipodis TaxID=124225 RepID=UPI00048FE597|nr:transcriptional repressor LexA [Brackiella oedipodis]
MVKLTARQQQVLTLIASAIERTGLPPTRAEIATQLGFKSTNAAEDHIKALAKKGVITLMPGTSRGIRINQDCQHYLPTSSAPDLSELPMAANEAVNQLPIIGKVAAGNPILAQANIEKHIQVDKYFFETKPDYLLRVKGESMINAGIFDGDLLAVKRAHDARNGQIVVARINDEVTVKRFHKLSHRIELIAENDNFAPIIVTPQDTFSLEGLAVGLLRSF